MEIGVAARSTGGGPRPGLLRRTAVVAVALVAGLWLAGAPGPVPRAEAREAPASFSDLAARLLPAVVNISTTQQIPQQDRRRGELPQAPPGSPLEDLFRDFFGDRPGEGGRGERQRRGTSLGSGFIIDGSGYIVTNNHVIEGADEITVHLHDDTQLKAKLVGRDKEIDIAVLKVEPPGRKPLPSVKFGDSDKMRIGDWVVAIGNPFGLGGTVTAGIVSARSREIGGKYDDYLQTDAAINKGNSGGPLFNMDGEVIGINTAIFSPTGTSLGIGFSIPSNIATGLVEQLREFGRVRRGWIGVQIQSISEDMAEALGLDKARGALVAGVTPTGPSDKAGLRQRDVILSFNGRDVLDSKKLPRIVADSKVGETVDMVVMRGGKRTTLKIKVGELDDGEKQTASAGPGGSGKPAPKPEAEPPGTVEPFGVTVARITEQLREKHQLGDAQKGVVVIRVAPGSPAAEKGIKVGDLILEVAQSAVNTPSEVLAKVKELREQKKKAAVLLVETRGDPRFVALRFQN
ncbi:MAG: DegQ family serine endoprotease [Rhodospirillales bacterium]|nr:DegQ family serine endoprotease [Rhodospirillales bacterium]QQS15175.1 MAG: DegQ family serine endoprotease [Rhodospirillales bacterium]